jgi:beta-galactosidase
VIIDGLNISTDKVLKTNYDKAVNAGARIIIWGVSPETLTSFNKILPFPLALEPRKATSFLKLQDAPILSGLEHSDFYFSELLPRGKTALNYGMTGEMVKNATVLLTACNAEWQAWNGRPEPTKTGSVFRSELEKKGVGTTLITFNQGKSEVMIASFDFKDMSIESESPIRLMLTNLGIQFDNSIYENKRAVDLNGKLIKFKEDADGISFWVFSPRSLVDLLAEPDMPKLSLEIKEAANFSFVLNGDRRAPQKEIPLDRGWNKFEIRFKENIAENKQKIKVSFKCDYPEFFKQINSMSER